MPWRELSRDGLYNGNVSAFIGTSGWHYDHWRDVFYPPDLRPKDYLAFYARHFSTVEVNNTFYQLPTAGTVRNWAMTTPAGFSFALKASQYITHRKRLRDPATTLGCFMEIASLLGEKLGPFLFQLPPRFKVDLPRLEAFLDTLPKNSLYAFEFRDHSWFVPEVRDALIRHNAAFCLYDQAGLVTPVWITAPFVYVRLHGPGEMCQGRYSEEMLRPYAARILEWANEGRQIFCYFNNDPRGNAVENARMLIEMLGPSVTGLS